MKNCAIFGSKANGFKADFVKCVKISLVPSRNPFDSLFGVARQEFSFFSVEELFICCHFAMMCELTIMLNRDNFKLLIAVSKKAQRNFDGLS